MPWKRTDVHEQRIQFVVRVVSGRESLAGLCREFGISRPTGYRWRERYQQAEKLTEMQERSRRPWHSPQRTEEWKEQRVVTLRQQYGWGAKKLQVMLAEEDIELPVVTLNRILKRNGLVPPEQSHGPAVERFERARPNELWQMDGKGWYGMREGICYPLSILDDHSRYAVGLYALPRFNAEAVHRCLVETFQCYGVPEAMLLDHDPLWWSNTNGYGLTWLSVRLIQQGIQLHYGRVGHPQTQGKVERFHRTLDEALQHEGRPQQWAEWGPALARFRHCYNHVRPHEALGMQRPVERYRPSARAYQPQPPEWAYPEGSEVKRLNSQGCLDEGGDRWFVCEALAGERVRIERFDGRLLVSYRHMYVREIDPCRRTSQAVVVPQRVGRGAAATLSQALWSPSGLPPGPTQRETQQEEV